MTFCVNSKRIIEFGINKFYAKNESSKNFRCTITLDKSISKVNFSESFDIYFYLEDAEQNILYWINIIQVQDLNLKFVNSILNKNLIRRKKLII